MKTWVSRTIALVVLVAASSLNSKAQAADDPPVLEQTALVVRAIECPFPCDNPPPHFHEDFSEWDLEPGETTFKVHRKLWKRSLRFFDLPWNFWNKMQRPDLHLINGDKHPISFENFGEAELLKAAAAREHGAEEKISANAKWPVVIDDFLFAFTIHDLKNTGTNDSTPHAIIYLPVRWDLKLPKHEGDNYLLFVFHIPYKVDDCQLVKYTIGKRHCRLLFSLAEKWESENYTTKGLTEEVRRKYRHFLDNIFKYALADIPQETQPAMLRTQQISVVLQWVFEILLHNGIIHGTLSGG